MDKISIIAEIGWNHMGDMNLAEKMIKNASKNGADICKFQTWSVKNLKSGPWDDDGRKEVYEKAELTKEQHYKLKEICQQNNVKFLTSVFNQKDINFLSELSPEMIKIPSHEINNYELISKSIDAFSIVIISTGASKWEEILKITNNLKMDNVVLMHCVSSYPCPAEQVNMKRMLELKKFAEIGYSGHQHGINDSILAISMGAKFIEKHFTIDPNLPGRDNKFAITPNQLKDLCDYKNDYINMLINKGLDLQDSELDTFNNYRGRWSNE